MADYAMNWRLDTAFDKLRQRPRQQRPRWLSLSKPARLMQHVLLRQICNLKSKICTMPYTPDGATETLVIDS